MRQLRKIVHVVEAYGGGVLDIVNLVANGLAEVTEQVIVYAARPQTPVAPERLLHPRVRLVKAPLQRGLHPCKDLRGLVWLMRFLRAERPDVVHLHSSKAGALGRLACFAIPQARVYYTPHQFAFLDSSTPGWLRLVYKGIERVLAHLSSSTVLACSESECAEARALGAKAVVVENAAAVAAPDDLDVLLAKRVERLRQSGTLTVCAVGRLVGQKNPQLFDAMARAAAQRGHRWRFVWAGDGPIRLEHAEVLGWLPTADVVQVLAQKADVYVSTARSEGMPIAALQAQLLGVPCVVTEVPGNRDAVRGMPMCRAVPADADALVDAVEQTAASASVDGLSALRKAACRRYAPNRLLSDLARHYSAPCPFKPPALYRACRHASNAPSTLSEQPPDSF